MSFFKVPGAILAVCGILASELNPESGECALSHFFLSRFLFHWFGTLSIQSHDALLVPASACWQDCSSIGVWTLPLTGSSPVMLYCDLTLVFGLAAIGEVSMYIYFAMERLLHHLHKNDGLK